MAARQLASFRRGRRYPVATIFQLMRWTMTRSTAARISDKYLLASVRVGENSSFGGFLRECRGVPRGNPNL